MNPFKWISEWFTGSPGEANRKYVDLILRESTYWATYRPHQAFGAEVGDYGHIEKDTGEFVRVGNIYKDSAILAQVPDLKKPEFQPKECEGLNKSIITAKTARKTNMAAGPSANIAGAVEASIDVEVTFNEGERGAFLLMYNPHELEIPKDKILEQLSRIPALHKCYLVTSVVNCPAFVLQVSDKSATSTRVKFVGQIPIPNAPAVNAGGKVEFGWKNDYCGASYREGCNEKGEHVYRPLYMLKKVRAKPSSNYRQTEQVKKGDDTWTNVSPPWSTLDEDGNEEPDDE